jgi:hypothetical protein
MPLADTCKAANPYPASMPKYSIIPPGKNMLDVVAVGLTPIFMNVSFVANNLIIVVNAANGVADKDMVDVVIVCEAPTSIA